MTNAIIHIDVAAEKPPTFHCVYNDTEFSAKVADHDITVYICGTFDQLRDWATNFISASIDGRAALAERNAAAQVAAADGED